MLETPNASETASKQDKPTEEQKKDTVISAVALGWSLIELLGRCYSITLPTPEKVAEKEKWTGEKMVFISPAITSQKSLMALVCFIQALIEKLQMHAAENDESINFLHDAVQELCNVDPNSDSRVRQLRGDINCHLFHWDIDIRKKLQEESNQLRNTYEYVNAYMVGKSFAALRWYDTETQEKEIEAHKEILDARYFAALREHVQLMAPYLYQFAPLALASSLDHWKNPILKRKICSSDSEEFQHQADIWYDLLTAERDPITYVTPSSISWQYTLRVGLFSLPFVLMGIGLGLVVTWLFFMLIGILWLPVANVFNANQIASSTVPAFRTGFSLLAGIGVALPTVKALWQWVIQKGQAGIEQGAGRALIDVFWEAAQQAVINSATSVNYRSFFSNHGYHTQSSSMKSKKQPKSSLHRHSNSLYPSSS